MKFSILENWEGVLFITIIGLGLLFFIFYKTVFLSQVKIQIIGKKSIKAKKGSTLLYSLAMSKIYLSSSCGGGGSCGRCKCRVISGGESHSPKEKSQLTALEIENGWHLACQIKLNNNILISLD